MKRFEELVLIGIASALATVWLMLWLTWVLRLANPELAPAPHIPWLVGGLVVTGAALTRRSLRPPAWSPRRARAIVGGAGLLGLAISVMLASPPAFTFADWTLGPNLGLLVRAGGPMFIVGLVAWRAGIHLGRGALAHHTLAGGFHTGVIALACLLLINSLWPVFGVSEVLLPMLLFFALGLCGLALTSLRQLRLVQRTVGVTHGGLTRYWVLTTLAAIGGLLMAGLLAASILMPETVELLAQATELAVHAALLAFALVLTPPTVLVVVILGPLLPRVFAALRAILTAMERLASIVAGLLSAIAGIATRRLPKLFTSEQIERLLSLPAIQATGRWGLVLGLVGVAGLIFWLAWRRLSRVVPLDDDEQRESIFSTQLMWSQIRQLLRRRRPMAAVAQFLPLTGATDDARLITRRAYQAMLKWAQSASLPRAVGQTPRAYADRLALAVPQGRDEIRALTGTYLLARYAAEAPSLDAARSAEGAAARLRSIAPESIIHG